MLAAAQTPSFFTDNGESVVSFDNGQPEVTASWAAAHHDGARFIDVREPHELNGPLGAAAGAQNVPLVQLLSQQETLDPAQPLMLICRSGRRSALAASTLRRSGWTDVVSVEGGMLAWNLEVLGNGHIEETERIANTSRLQEATYRTNGIAEVSARWVSENVGHFRLIDVRQPAELQQTGYVPQAENVPLGQLMQTAATWPREQPLVIMCASGGRSGRAVMALANAGFSVASSLEGGIYGWRAAGLPTVK
ncbi:MAG: hypothetical protein KC502_17810 [Myxococcales bacterium]|nr:hypothetical protein [Myxococcales bacterium]